MTIELTWHKASVKSQLIKLEKFTFYFADFVSHYSGTKWAATTASPMQQKCTLTQPVPCWHLTSINIEQVTTTTAATTAALKNSDAANKSLSLSSQIKYYFQMNEHCHKYNNSLTQYFKYKVQPRHQGHPE